MSDIFPIEHLFHPIDVPDQLDFISERLSRLAEDPLPHSQLNQLLLRSHQAGMTADFFRYYFLVEPPDHPYQIDRPPCELPELPHVISVDHLKWGLERFATDAILFWGDFRNAYRALRELSYAELVEIFSEKRVPSEWMRLRGRVMPMNEIPIVDRHLVSEFACKALDEIDDTSMTLAKRRLLDTFVKLGSERVSVEELVKQATEGVDDLQLPDGLRIITTDSGSSIVESEEHLTSLLDGIQSKFKVVRASALENTKHFLSICNELDVYVATSMRSAQNFRDTGESCERIFGSPALAPYNLRWFDPTVTACSSHEDKGLVECFMVDQARIVLYFAGETDSWGKDAEAAMALSRGKLVVVHCPETEKGRLRARVFKEVHPLSRLTDYVNGVAVGSIITNSEEIVVELMERYFENRMAYSLESDPKGFYLREQLTGSVVRVITRDEMLRQSFWNYYHNVP